MSERELKGKPGSLPFYDAPMVKRNIMLPEHQIKWLLVEAERRNASMSQLIREAIDQMMDSTKDQS